MKLMTESGVRVAVQEHDGRRVLSFDQPVRAIELSQQEAVHIGASLYRARKIPVFPNMVKLLESDFFNRQRTFLEIRKAIQKDRPDARPNSITMSLKLFCTKQILERTGSRRRYLYRKR